MAVKRFYEIFHPEHYDLRINVNRKNKEINGTSTITGDVIENPVFINQKFMTIDSVKVDGKDVDFEVVEKDEAIKIETGVTGRAVIEIAYSAPLTDTMMGIYPSYYELEGRRSKLSVRNLKLLLLVKHFHVLMNQKLRLPSPLPLSGMKKTAKWHLPTCQKLKLTKMATTTLKKLFVCQATLLHLPLVTYNQRLLTLRMAF